MGTNPSPDKIIGVSGNQLLGSHRHLFAALARLFPVRFVAHETAAKGQMQALLVLDGDLAAGLAAAASGVRTLAFLAGPGQPPLPPGHALTFAEAPSVERCLRGRTLPEHAQSPRLLLPTVVGDEVLASTPMGSLWVARRTTGEICQLSSVPPPVLPESALLLSYFHGRDFMGLVPLFCFLRQATSGLTWESPEPRACFVFDDPSLYWRSYGFLNYQALGEHAERHNYHAALATIPLDTWWVNDDVAATLRRHRSRLSLLVHGNNHSKQELLCARSPRSRLALAAQALRRMERLEHRHGIAFNRVMEAPHAALSCQLFPPLLALGYEGAICTPELLVRHNPGIAWEADVGLHPVELVGGFPVIPRIKMSPDWKNQVLLAALLHQPIVLAGHHQDAANKLSLLAEFAGLVNSLGPVVWSDVQGILRAAYDQRQAGETLLVRLHSRRVNVVIPPGVRRLQVMRPWLASGQVEGLVLNAGAPDEAALRAGPVTEEIDVDGAGRIVLASPSADPVALASVPANFTGPWPVIRKALVETRDRLTPFLPLIDRARRPGKTLAG